MNFRAHTWNTRQSTTESLSPSSRTVRAIAFSHPLQHMMDVVVLETGMSVLYTLTPCDPNTFCFNSWLSCTLYDHSGSLPLIPLDIFNKRHVGSSQICCHFTTQNNETDLKTNDETTDLLSFYNTEQWDRPQNKWWNKDISGLFIRPVWWVHVTLDPGGRKFETNFGWFPTISGLYWKRHSITVCVPGGVTFFYPSQ